ncbi:hypothetical protein SRABI27_01716 [Pedobacter sp. Bi27]|nr:hypothetical protein SRABI27_01716 [Pedobacter sp. Bi27]
MWGIVTKTEVKPNTVNWLKEVFMLGKICGIKRNNMEVKRTSLWMGITLSLIAVGVIFPMLLIVSVLFRYGGDWYYDVFQS